MSSVQQICDLGFSKDLALLALKLSHGNVDDAINFCLENGEESLRLFETTPTSAAANQSFFPSGASTSTGSSASLLDSDATAGLSPEDLNRLIESIGVPNPHGPAARSGLRPESSAFVPQSSFGLTGGGQDDDDLQEQLAMIESQQLAERSSRARKVDEWEEIPPELLVEQDVSSVSHISNMGDYGDEETIRRLLAEGIDGSRASRDNAYEFGNHIREATSEGILVREPTKSSPHDANMSKLTIVTDSISPLNGTSPRINSEPGTARSISSTSSSEIPILPPSRGKELIPMTNLRVRPLSVSSTSSAASSITAQTPQPPPPPPSQNALQQQLQQQHRQMAPLSQLASLRSGGQPLMSVSYLQQCQEVYGVTRSSTSASSSVSATPIPRSGIYDQGVGGQRGQQVSYSDARYAQSILRDPSSSREPKSLANPGWAGAGHPQVNRGPQYSPDAHYELPQRLDHSVSSSGNRPMSGRLGVQNFSPEAYGHVQDAQFDQYAPPSARHHAPYNLQPNSHGHYQQQAPYDQYAPPSVRHGHHHQPMQYDEYAPSVHQDHYQEPEQSHSRYQPAKYDEYTAPTVYRERYPESVPYDEYSVPSVNHNRYQYSDDDRQHRLNEHSSQQDSGYSRQQPNQNSDFRNDQHQPYRAPQTSSRVQFREDDNVYHDDHHQVDARLAGAPDQYWDQMPENSSHSFDTSYDEDYEDDGSAGPPRRGIKQVYSEGEDYGTLVVDDSMFS